MVNDTAGHQADLGVRFECNGKQEALDFMAGYKDLLTAEKEGFSYNKPKKVYFSGKKMN